MPYYYDGENYFREAGEEPSSAPRGRGPRVNYYDTRGDTSNYSYYKTPTERVVSVPTKPNDYDKYGKEITQYFLARGMKRREAAVRAQQVLESMQVEKTAGEQKSNWKQYVPWGVGAAATAGLGLLARRRGYAPKILEKLINSEGKLNSAAKAIDRAARNTKQVDHGNVIPTLVGTGGASTASFSSLDDAANVLKSALNRTAPEGKYVIDANKLNTVLGPSAKSQSWTERLPQWFGGVGKMDVKPYASVDRVERAAINNAHNLLANNSTTNLLDDIDLLTNTSIAKPSTTAEALKNLEGINLKGHIDQSKNWIADWIRKNPHDPIGYMRGGNKNPYHHQAIAANNVSKRIRALELASELQAHEKQLHNVVRESQQMANANASHLLVPLGIGGVAAPMAAEAYMNSSAPISPAVAGVKGPMQLVSESTGWGTDPVTSSVNPHIQAIKGHVSEYAPYYGVAAAAAAPLMYHAFNRGPSREELRIRGRL